MTEGDDAFDGPPRIRAIALCQAGYEGDLEKEVQWRGGITEGRDKGWVLLSGDGRRQLSPEPCFARLILFEPSRLEGESAGSLAGGLVEAFGRLHRSTTFQRGWPLLFETDPDSTRLRRRSARLRSLFEEGLRKRMSRVARLAYEGLPDRWGLYDGWWVWLSDVHQAWFGRQLWYGGQRRMADDPAAPSRSFLKIEEAYRIAGEAVAPGQSVADLGAAPGGWSYSAVQRGATVYAIDHAALRGGARNHPNLVHLQQDAFLYRPSAGRQFDWLFCDIVEQPQQVLHLLEQWVGNRWCRRFIVNLKYGRVSPLHLLERIYDPQTGLVNACHSLRCRHLYHNREELTVVGELKS